MSDKFLNNTGLENLWSKIKSQYNLKANASDVMTNEEIDELFTPSVDISGLLPVGGIIFATPEEFTIPPTIPSPNYTFYDSNYNVITDTSLSGLQSAKYYKVDGEVIIPSYKVIYPEPLINGDPCYWGFLFNRDITGDEGYEGQFSEAEVITMNTFDVQNGGVADKIVYSGKEATRDILNYINTHSLDDESPSDAIPDTEISLKESYGYNLYKNCGEDKPYLWDVIRDFNNSYPEGLNDWYIPNMDEGLTLVGSGVMPTSITAFCTSDAYPHKLVWEGYYANDLFVKYMLVDGMALEDFECSSRCICLDYALCDYPMEIPRDFIHSYGSAISVPVIACRSF